ncbi:MAG TPA: hypothetical protein VK157_16790 [Phycisphaerales bacterium]|nr:hypothetical protein [Phycisphaerales bacterium]
MRIFVAIGLLVGLATLAAAGARVNQQDKPARIGPRMNVEFDVLDLGEISDKDVQFFSFRFTNVGDEPLEVTWIRRDNGDPGNLIPPVEPATEIFVDAFGCGMVGPRLSISQSTFPMYMNADGSYTAEIPFTNTGDLALEVIDVAVGP